MRANFQRAVHAAIKLVFSSNAALYAVAGLAEQAGGEYANIPCRETHTEYIISNSYRRDRWNPNPYHSIGHWHVSAHPAVYGGHHVVEPEEGASD